MRFKSSFTLPSVAAIGFCLIGGTVRAAAYAGLSDPLYEFLANNGAAHESPSIQGEQL